MLTRRAAAEYEQDDDFQFVRKSKKAKTAEEPPQPVALPVRKSGRGRPPSAATVAARERAARRSIRGEEVDEEEEVVELIAAEKVPRATTTAKKASSSRRKAPSNDAIQDEPPAKISKRGTRKSLRLSSDDAEPEEEQQAPPPPRTNGSSSSQRRGKKTAKSKAPPPVIQEEEHEEDISIVDSSVHETSTEPTKIKLPMSDTPIINRNKEMRKKGGTGGNRRSSLGSRGRRASSLIESGQTAIPHREVSTNAFYKHIEADLLEPRRMKQLLMWCGERALSAKPRGTLNSGVVLGGKDFFSLLRIRCLGFLFC